MKMKTIKINEPINIDPLGDCRLVSIESSHTITVQHGNKFYRVSGLDLTLASVTKTPDTTYAQLRK
jgi:hypothetical protein